VPSRNVRDLWYCLGDVIIRILGEIDARRLEMVRAGAGTDVVQYGESASPAFEASPEVLFVWAQRRPVLADILARDSAQLRWVHFRRVGIGASIVSLFETHPHIHLSNGSGASGIAVAEHALALLLALLKRLPELGERQREHDWAHEFTAAELRGRTACLVGLGDVGLSVARILRPFGVRLLGVRRQREPVAEVDETYAVEDLGDVLKRCSVLILAPTLNPSTQHLVGSDELARLPSGALVINIGRGAVVDEAALISALRSGHLGGAGLDVVEQEPLAPESPLWDMRNVIVTPHSAAHTEATDDRAVQLFLENLERLRRGQALQSLM
jgi:phosphoglycerate dehydrogenase-like enzyme